MTQAYSDPTRATDPFALPDVEVFYNDPANGGLWHDGEPLPAGWYFWFCFPGCLPDSDPDGPYGTEAEALAKAQDDAS